MSQEIIGVDLGHSAIKVAVGSLCGDEVEITSNRLKLLKIHNNLSNTILYFMQEKFA